MKRIACVLTAAAMGLAPLASCQSSSTSHVSREDQGVMQNGEGEQTQQGISTDSDMRASEGNFAEPGSLGADE